MMIPTVPRSWKLLCCYHLLSRNCRSTGKRDWRITFAFIKGWDVASRTPREAVEAFMQPLQLSLSCITDAVLNYRSYSNKDYQSQEPLPLTINNGYPVPLLVDDDLFFSFRMFYRVGSDSKGRGSWEAAVAAYSYLLNDRAHQEILAYHWHPDTRNSVDFPHMHLGAGTGMTRRELFRAHLLHRTYPLGRHDQANNHRVRRSAIS